MPKTWRRHPYVWKGIFTSVKLTREMGQQRNLTELYLIPYVPLGGNLDRCLNFHLLRRQIRGLLVLTGSQLVT